MGGASGEKVMSIKNIMNFMKCIQYLPLQLVFSHLGHDMLYGKKNKQNYLGSLNNLENS